MAYTLSWLGNIPPTLPYSLPGAGASSTITGNTAQDIKPSDFTDTQFNYSLYNSFGSGIYIPDYSTHGAFVIGGSGGHQHPDFTGAVAFNFTTGAWVLHEHNNGGTRYGGSLGDKGYTLAQTSGTPYYEITGSGETPCPAHPYQNPTYLPTSLGGGPKGSFMYVGRGAIGENGTAHSASTHKFDLDTNVWARVTTNQASRAAYETGVVYDAARGRYWYCPQGAENDSFVAYLRASDWTWRTDASYAGFPPGQVGNAGRAWLLQGILFLQTLDGGLLSFDPDDAASGWQSVTISGSAGSTLPSNRNRFVHYPATDKLYWCPQTGGTTLNRLTKPAGNIRTGTWTHDTVTITPGLTAQTTAGDPGGSADHVGALIYASGIERLAWFPGGANPVQLLNPT